MGLTTFIDDADVGIVNPTDRGITISNTFVEQYSLVGRPSQAVIRACLNCLANSPLGVLRVGEKEQGRRS